MFNGCMGLNIRDVSTARKGQFHGQIYQLGGFDYDGWLYAEGAD